MEEVVRRESHQVHQKPKIYGKRPAPQTDAGGIQWSRKSDIGSMIFPQVYFWRLSKVPVRELRYAAWSVTGQPTEFRYRRLVPNYNHYWMPDSDAVNSLDRHETALWFASRGDECLNCGGSIRGWDLSQGPLILKIHKTGTPAR